MHRPPKDTGLIKKRGTHADYEIGADYCFGGCARCADDHARITCARIAIVNVQLSVTVCACGPPYTWTSVGYGPGPKRAGGRTAVSVASFPCDL